MRCAIKSAPLATSRGACIVFSSYFSATAKCVGIGDHHVRGGHILLQSLHGALHGDLPLPLLDLRVAVHPAHLFLHLLLGHLQRLLDAIALVDVIEDRQDQQQNADAHADGVDDSAPRPKIWMNESRCTETICRAGRGSRSRPYRHQRHLQEAHHQVNHPLPAAEHFSESPDRVQRPRLGGSLCRIEMQPDLRHVASTAISTTPPRIGATRSPRSPMTCISSDAQPRHIDARHRARSQHFVQHRPHAGDEPKAKPLQQQQRADKNQSGGEVGAAGDVSLLAGFLPRAGRGCFGFVAFISAITLQPFNVPIKANA